MLGIEIGNYFWRGRFGDRHSCRVSYSFILDEKVCSYMVFLKISFLKITCAHVNEGHELEITSHF